MTITGDRGGADGQDTVRDDGGERGERGERGDSGTSGTSQESGVVLVDVLAAAEDYWLTITDAARVTRRQEITIRRWIAAGALPVRRQRMGLNKRTRQVRASDLARLTPIIDPTAAITGAPAQADLLSIPVQQAQLLTTQQTLTARLTQDEQTLADLAAQRDADHQVLAQQETLLHATTHATAALHQDVQSEIAVLRDATQTELGQLQQSTAALTLLVQRVDAALHDAADQLAHERTERVRGHAELVAGLAAQSAAIQQLEVVTQQVQTKWAQVELEQRAWQQQLGETRELLLLQQRLTTALSDELTAVRRERQEEQQDWQRQLSVLQERTAATHADLLARLQTERQRRRVLEQQLRIRASPRRRVARGQAMSHVDVPGGTISERGAH